jgi:hypothetical protein
MATVVDRSGNTPLDRKLASPNRIVAASPAGTLAPMYAGEMVLDSTTGTIYYALGLTSSSWALASIGA